MADIEFSRVGDWGIISLNRPQVLNSLTHDMVKLMDRQLINWETDESVKAVMVTSTSEKAFCAGGDVVWLHDVARRSPEEACVFFHDEYNLNARIKHYPKPYVSFTDGINMGGGVGISVHGHYTIAGDRTLFAMPETNIGMLPDVGGGYFLSRLHDGLGVYFGMTGARAKGADCLFAGVATHFVRSKAQAALLANMHAASLGDQANVTIKALIEDVCTTPEAPMSAQIEEITTHFGGGKTTLEIFQSLESSQTEFAQTTLKTLVKMSAVSLVIARDLVTRAQEMTFDQNMEMEYRVVNRVMRNPDFFEGVRALLIDKDKSPIWEFPHVSAIPAGHVEAYFEPLDELGVPELVLA